MEYPRPVYVFGMETSEPGPPSQFQQRLENGHHKNRAHRSQYPTIFLRSTWLSKHVARPSSCYAKSSLWNHARYAIIKKNVSLSIYIQLLL